jgi:iron-sulfur cluster repair protein YtfE (RIC family)
MNAIDLLVTQHKEARDLMDKCLAAEGADKLSLCEDIATALALHTSIEEQIFYPACRKAGFEDEIKEAIEEHSGVKKILTQLVAIEEEGPELDRLLTQVKHDVLHHVEEEENELFPQVRQKLGDQLDDLGDSMMELADRLSQGDVVESMEEETGARV